VLQGLGLDPVTERRVEAAELNPDKSHVPDLDRNCLGGEMILKGPSQKILDLWMGLRKLKRILEKNQIIWIFLIHRNFI